MTRIEVSEKRQEFYLYPRSKQHATCRFEKESRTTSEPNKYWKEKGTGSQ